MAATRRRTKSYIVRFFAARLHQADEDAPSYRIQDLFKELVQAAQSSGGHCPATSDGSLSYELRDIRSINYGAVVIGVFAVLRDEAPSIRAQDRSERPIPLGEDEGLIEKNHFLFYASTGLIVYQVNQRANHPSRFEQYLTNMAGPGRGVTFGDILTRDAWNKLSSGIVKRVEVTIDTPKTPESFDPEDFTGRTLGTMQHAAAQKAKIVLSAARGEGMSRWLREQLMRLRGGAHIEALKVRLEGEDGLLDLLANTLRDKIEVLLDGPYPNTRETFYELEAAYSRQREALRAHFGQ